jgi:hypothetical protein
LKKAALVTVVVLFSFIAVPNGRAQEGPPDKFRICANLECETATYTGKGMYSGIADQQPVKFSYEILVWEPSFVNLFGIRLQEDGGHFLGNFTGTISGQENNVYGHWWLGDENNTPDFVMSWNKEDMNGKAAADYRKTDIHLAYAAERAKGSLKMVGNVDIPVGASNDFAQHEAYIRAILRREHPTTARMDQLPCAASTGIDAIQAMEIGRYAIRAADYTRGFCWVKRSAEMGSSRGMALSGMAFMLGWGTPKDPNAAFRYFKAAYDKNDGWGLYLLHKAYWDGVGVAQDRQKGAEYFNEAIREAPHIISAFGAEKIEDVSALNTMNARARAMERARLLMDPPMMENPHCGYDSNNLDCRNHPQVVDEEDLDRQLADIDRKYSH